MKNNIKIKKIFIILIITLTAVCLALNLVCFLRVKILFLFPGINYDRHKEEFNDFTKYLLETLDDYECTKYFLQMDSKGIYRYNKQQDMEKTYVDFPDDQNHNLDIIFDQSGEVHVFMITVKEDYVEYTSMGGYRLIYSSKGMPSCKETERLIQVDWNWYVIRQ